VRATQNLIRSRLLENSKQSRRKKNKKSKGKNFAIWVLLNISVALHVPADHPLPIKMILHCHTPFISIPEHSIRGFVTTVVLAIFIFVLSIHAFKVNRFIIIIIIVYKLY